MDDALQIAAWRFATGELRSDELCHVATGALVGGLDSPSLRELAGLSPHDEHLAVDLFMAALDEVGITMPSEDEALWGLVRHTARQIVAGDLPPDEGARWIWRNASWRVQEEGDLRVFIGLASDWEDFPDLRTETEREIVQAAAELLDRPAPRRWIQLYATVGSAPLRRARNVPRAGWAPVDPTSLPLSASLRDEIARWSAVFGVSEQGFGSQDDAVEFVERGYDIVERLQAELGDAWHVEYMPEPTEPPGLRLKGRARRKSILRLPAFLRNPS